MTKHEIEILNVMRSRARPPWTLRSPFRSPSIPFVLTSAATRRKMLSGSNAASAESPFSR